MRRVLIPVNLTSYNTVTTAIIPIRLLLYLSSLSVGKGSSELVFLSSEIGVLVSSLASRFLKPFETKSSSVPGWSVKEK